jgi:hypothetical protein
MVWPVANFVGHRPAIRHRSCGGFRRAAAEAVELFCLASSLVRCPTNFKGCGKVIPRISTGRFSSLVESPAFTLARTVIFVDTEQAGDLVHRVAVVLIRPDNLL